MLPALLALTALFLLLFVGRVGMARRAELLDEVHDDREALAVGGPALGPLLLAKDVTITGPNGPVTVTTYATTGTKATVITDWLKADYGLGHGHAVPR